VPFFIYKVGSPAQDIVKIAKEEMMHVIVISSHGESAFHNFVFGSVTEKDYSTSPLNATALAFFFVSILIIAICPQHTTAKEATATAKESQQQVPAAKDPSLDQAVMCEEIVNFAPEDQAIVFSVDRGKVFCFTSFVNVPENTIVYHRWLFRDKLVTERELELKTPKWSVYSSIQPRQADKGPWRVEITN
jgi:hypothetical protein